MANWAGLGKLGTGAKGKPMNTSEIRSALEQLCAAFNAHHLDKIMSFFAENCVLEMPRGSQPWGSRYKGKENVRKALAGRFEGLPDVPVRRRTALRG